MASTPTPSPLPRPRFWGASAGIFFGLLLLYQLNGPFFRIGDVQPNLYLPVQLLTRGSVSFTPEEAPFMFLWKLQRVRPQTVQFHSWDDLVDGTPASALRDGGQLTFLRPKYYLVESVRPGRYVGIYGPGAGLIAVPYFALISLMRPGWHDDGAVLGSEAKLFASACVAGSAVCLFWSFLLYLPFRPSLLLSLLYGAGTCVWTEPSQALWQQTPAILFVALGAFCFLKLPDGSRWAAACGAAWGLAAFCRPSLAVLPAAAAVYALIRARRMALLLAGGAALPVLSLLLFNAVQLGSPFRFGQALAAGRLVVANQEASGAWAGNPLVGMAGLLVSPSRGLLIFSPFFLYAFWGAVRSWKQPSDAPFRMLSIAVLLLLGIAATWVQWWGGWSFGYRLISELTPLWMLLLIPASDRFLAPRSRLSIFGLLAFWSVSLQALGAFGYESSLWNNRSSFRIRTGGAEGRVELVDMETAVGRRQEGSAEILGTVEMDVSRPEYRRRLWSFTDGQIAWLLRPHAVREGYALRRALADNAARERMSPPR
jgi:hypothetical protein